MDRLQQQLKRPENKKDAQECIKIYNWIKDTDPDGKVWSGRWEPLTKVKFEGFHKRNYSLNIMGKTLLKGIENDR